MALGSFGGFQQASGTLQAQPDKPFTSLSPGQQAGAPGGMGYDQYGILKGQGSGIVPVGQQAAQDVGGFQTAGYQYNIADQGPVQGSVLNNAQNFNTQYIDPSQAPVSSIQQGDPYMQKMQDAYMQQAQSRLDPMWQQRADQQATMLANQGITPGSEAWNRQMSQFNMGRNDAYGSAMNQAILNSGQEAARLQGMDINAGNFANQAAQQNYQNQLTSQAAQNQALTGQQAQDLAAGGFANQAQAQKYNQAMGAANLNNQALQTQQGIASQQAMSQRQADAAAAQAAANAFWSGSQQAQMNAYQQAQLGLQERQMTNAEQQQMFNNALTMQQFPLQLQNMAMQGMYPTGPAQMPSYSTPGYSNPYGSMMSQGANNAAQGAGGLGVQLGNMLPSMGGASLGYGSIDPTMAGYNLPY